MRPLVTPSSTLAAARRAPVRRYTPGIVQCTLEETLPSCPSLSRA